MPRNIAIVHAINNAKKTYQEVYVILEQKFSLGSIVHNDRIFLIYTKYWNPEDLNTDSIADNHPRCLQYNSRSDTIRAYCWWF